MRFLLRLAVIGDATKGRVQGRKEGRRGAGGSSWDASGQLGCLWDASKGLYNYVYIPLEYLLLSYPRSPRTPITVNISIKSYHDQQHTMNTMAGAMQFSRG